MDFKQFYKTINFDIDNEIRTAYQATQGDTKSRGLVVDLIVGGVKTPVTTETMNFFALKPDGTQVMTAGVKDGDKFRIDFTNQTFAVPGTLLCALVLYGTNGEKIADRKFKMTVDTSLEDGVIISKDERGILDRAFDLASDIVPRLEDLDVPLLENLEQRFDNLIATPVPTGEIIAEEIIDARDGKVSVGAKIRSVDAQLAQIENLENYELNSKRRQKNAFTIFRSDDGRHEEFTHALPLFSAKGVPQNIAIVSDWVGGSNFVSKEQLLELQNAHGWEILSHSKSHPTRSGGQSMIPDLPESDARYELKQGRDDLRQMGLNVDSYAIVGGQYIARDRQLFREYYRSTLSSASGRYRGLNQSPISSHDMYTHWIDPTAGDLMEFLQTDSKAVAIQKTLQNAYEAVDYASEHGGILIFGTHYRYIAADADYTQMYSDLIDYAKLKTKVTTLSDALNSYGNIVEIGDNANLSANQSATKRARTNHFVVGIDGKTSGGNLSDVDEFDGDSDWREFPLGVNHTPVTGDKAVETGLPEGASGILTNHKLSVSPLQYGIYNYQVYKINRSDIEYHRFLDGELKFSEWFLKNSAINVHGQGAQNLSSTPESYSLGLTYHNVTLGNNHISLAPDQVAGLLVTQKPSNNQIGFTFQLYYPLYESDKSPYVRRGLSETGWSGWGKLTQSRIRSGDENTYDTSSPITVFPVGVTLTGIGGDHPDVSNTPTGGAGTLTTYKVHASGLVGRSYQEFHAFSTGDIYKRVPTGNNTWGGWRKILME